jgi:serine/threonine protein kinase
MLKEGNNDDKMKDLLQEVAVMQKIGKHDNIVNLLGCCRANGELMVIVECALKGSLKNYLKGLQKFYTSTELYSLFGLLVNFSWQIACGMEYLESKKCVHRDLAARNILIDLSYKVKICDFGLARGVKDADYYKNKEKGGVPYRSMAPESVAELKYTSKSDV